MGGAAGSGGTVASPSGGLASSAGSGTSGMFGVSGGAGSGFAGGGSSNAGAAGASGSAAGGMASVDTSAELYDPERVPRFDIDLPAASVSALGAAPDVYVRGTLRYGAE